MAEVLISPDVAEQARSHLAAALPGVQCVAGTTPPALAAQSVAVTRVGGFVRDMVTDVATISVDCRDLASEAGAEALALRVDALLRAAAVDGRLGSAVCHETTVLAGVYTNPDPVHPDLYRASASYQVAVRMIPS